MRRRVSVTAVAAVVCAALAAGGAGVAAATHDGGAEPDLTLRAFGLPATAVIGQNLTFALNLTNHGFPSTETVFFLTEPIGAEPVGGLIEGGHCETGGEPAALFCEAGRDLAPGEFAVAVNTLRVQEPQVAISVQAGVVANGTTHRVSLDLTARAVSAAGLGEGERLACEATDAGNRLTWPGAEAAAPYTVRRATGDGAFETVAEVEDARFLDEAVDAGATYRYRVLAQGDGGNGELVGACQVTAIPAFPTWPAAALVLVVGLGAYVMGRQRRGEL